MGNKVNAPGVGGIPPITKHQQRVLKKHLRQVINPATLAKFDKPMDFFVAIIYKATEGKPESAAYQTLIEVFLQTNARSWRGDGVWGALTDFTSSSMVHMRLVKTRYTLHGLTTLQQCWSSSNISIAKNQKDLERVANDKYTKSALSYFSIALTPEFIRDIEKLLPLQDMAIELDLYLIKQRLNLEE